MRAILGQTEGRHSVKLIEQARCEMIEDGMEAGKCLLRSRLLHNMILPALTTTFECLDRDVITVKTRESGLMVLKPSSSKA